jgi:crotonobetainyl-CoA:carnitine CoA-transferase CaiB-like acyl-CoA transferase
MIADHHSIDDSALLSGIRVVCFEHMLQGPLASLMLCSLGADVIKVEPLTGSLERRWTGRGQWKGGRSVLDLIVNRGKQSLALDLKHPRARDVLDRLLQSSDAVTHNYRPGVMERLGLGFDDLSRRFPQLVYGAASGYGEGGPYNDLPGQDLLVQAMTGMMYLNGRESDPPIPLGSTMIDVHSGTLLALAIVSGLVHRQKSGRGTKVGVDLLASAIHLMFEPAQYVLNSDEPLVRGERGLADPYHHAPYGVYPTADGHIAISSSDMAKLTECLGSPEEVDLPLDVSSKETFAQRNTIYATIAAVTERRSTAYWLSLFKPAGIWAEEVRRPERLRDDDEVKHRGLVETVPGAAPVDVFRVPVQVSGKSPSNVQPAPPIGGNSRQILACLGYSVTEIAELISQGVVGAPDHEEMLDDA